jgi:hypothetical protein
MNGCVSRNGLFLNYYYSATEEEGGGTSGGEGGEERMELHGANDQQCNTNQPF